MKAFVFRLQRVMAWRVAALKTAEVRLEEVRFGLETAKREKKTLDDVLSTTKQSAALRPDLHGSDLHAIHLYSARLQRETRAVEQKIKLFDEAVARQILVVTECDREVRLMERLRDRRLKDWQSECDRELDEVASDFSGSQWLRLKTHSEPASARSTVAGELPAVPWGKSVTAPPASA